MEHVDIGLGEMHRAHNWEYTDATARAAASGFVAGDVGKLAWQKSDNTYWILTDDSPITWAQIGSGGTLDPDLADIAALTPSNDDVLQRKAGAWTNRTMAQLWADLAAAARTFAEIVSFDKAKRLKVVVLTDAATVAVDASAGDAFYLSTANSRAFGIPSSAPATGYSQVITVTVKNTSGGSVTPTLTTTGSGCWRYGTTVTSLPAIAAGKSMAFTARWHQADSVWDVLGVAQDF